MGEVRPSLTPVIEAAYRPAGTLEAWLDAVTSQAAPLLEGHHGAVGRILDTHTGAGVGSYSIHVTDELVRRTLRVHERQSQNRIDFLRTGRSVSRTPIDDAYVSAMHRRFRAIGVHDMLHLTAHDGGRYWVTIGFLASCPTGRLWCPRTWVSATKHIAAGLRLQRRVHELEERFARVDAGGDREALRRVARAVDASGPGLELEQVHRLWRGLVDGTWSIVDRHDAAGRRYLVAVPAFGVRDPRGLSAREAQVAALVSEGYSEKWIACTLGIARTTVANHLTEALDKLDLSSSLALVATFHAHDERGPG
jgi:DNA-binding CsgD family transcriptional regulator